MAYAVALGLGSGPPHAATAQQVPAGFVVENVVGGSMASQVSGFAFLPDGRIVILEKDTGGVRLSAVGSGVSTLVATLPDVSVAAERGLLGVAVDPAWPQRPFLYFMYTRTGGSVFLVMCEAAGALDDPSSTALVLDAPYVLLDDIPDLFDNHNGGTLRFGPDGFLYASVGDDSQSCQAQDPSMHMGKILRLDVSGMPGPGSGPPPKSALVVSTNPFTGSDNARLVLARGFRNPFRFTVDPATGEVFVGDVGLETWEEVNVIDPDSIGGNYGWPEFEGPLQDPEPNSANCSTGPFVAPVYVYPNPPGGAVASVVCGPTYRSPAGAASPFPAAYAGDLFICEFYARWIRRLERTPAGWAVADPVAGQPTATEWATNLGNVSDLQVGPDGSLYVLVLFSAGFLPRGVHRIRSTLPSDVESDPRAAPLFLRATPNPARTGSDVRIVYRPARGETVPALARIVDVRGRVVRILPLGPAGAGAGAAGVEWNGRDGRGAFVGPGLYVVEVTPRTGATVRTKLTVVR